MFVLQELMREYKVLKSSSPNTCISIPLHEVDLRARELGILDFRSVLGSSKVFNDAGWSILGDFIQQN